MRYGARRSAKFAEGDMTPMIDMTFQLIAFFMVLVNFAEVDQHEKIRLPGSELAKPPDTPLEWPITIHVTSDDTMVFLGEEVSVEGLTRLLRQESRVLNETTGRSAAAATVVIRGDRMAKTGMVQRVIKEAQEAGFERFALRARQEQPRLTMGGT